MLRTQNVNGHQIHYDIIFTHHRRYLTKTEKHDRTTTRQNGADRDTSFIFVTDRVYTINGEARGQ